MNYQIIEKSNLKYLIFENKEYIIWKKQGKFLKVFDETIKNNLNLNIFNLETEEFILKEWVWSCWPDNFGIKIWN